MKKDVLKIVAVSFVTILGLLIIAVPYASAFTSQGSQSCDVNGKEYFNSDQCISDGNSPTDCIAACPQSNTGTAGGSGTTNSGTGNSGTSNSGSTGTSGDTAKCPDGWQAVGAGTCAPPSPATTGFLGTKTIGELITNVLKVLLALSGVIAVALVVVGGFQYMTSAGNAEAAEKGKNTLVNAIIGLVIVMISWLVISLVTNTLTSGKLF